jgi:hypothetical protein
MIMTNPFPDSLIHSWSQEFVDRATNRRERVLFNIPFVGTPEEARAIYVRVTNSKAYKDWDSALILVVHGDFDAFTPQADAMAEKVSSLYLAVRDETLLAIADMEKQRDDAEDDEVAK